MISYYLSLVETEEDKEKIEYIFNTFNSFMSYTAGEVLHHNKQDVEDAVQNAMVVIIENLKMIDTTDYQRLRNLCGIISKNKAKDYCKLKDNQAASLDDTTLETLSSKELNPEGIVLQNDTYEILVKAIYDLDEKYRDVCILKYVNGYKEREIAIFLDLPPKTVSTRIFRGKNILREALRKEKLHV